MCGNANNSEIAYDLHGEAEHNAHTSDSTMSIADGETQFDPLRSSTPSS